MKKIRGFVLWPSIFVFHSNFSFFWFYPRASFLVFFRHKYYMSRYEGMRWIRLLSQRLENEDLLVILKIQIFFSYATISDVHNTAKRRLWGLDFSNFRYGQSSFPCWACSLYGRALSKCWSFTLEILDRCFVISTKRNALLIFVSMKVFRSFILRSLISLDWQNRFFDCFPSQWGKYSLS